MIAAFVFFNKYTIASVKVLMFLNLFIFFLWFGGLGYSWIRNSAWSQYCLSLSFISRAVPSGEAGWGGEGGGLGSSCPGPQRSDKVTTTLS